MSALRSLRQFYNEVLQEPIPDPFLRMLASLSDGSGAAVAQSGLTELASDIRHSDRASREIHAVHDPAHLITTPDAGHALTPPAKLSTPCNRGGSA